MSDLFLGIADPEFWRNCGYALLAIGLIGTVAVILLLDRKPRLQKGLALLFLAVVLAGLGVARFGNNALLSEARERAAAFEPEPGISVKLVSPAEIARLIKRGVFLSQLHIGALLLAELHGFLALPRNTPRPARRLRRARKLTRRP